MSYLILYIILLIFVVIFSSTVSCITFVPASELIYNGMYPYSNEGFSNVDEEGFHNNDEVYVKGFNGLMSKPGSSSTIGGIHEGATSHPKCKSYGYTTSKGNVCLNKKQLKLLSTRGGNCDKVY